MKGKFTKIMAALALLVFMMPSLVAWGQSYEQTNSISVGDIVVITCPTKAKEMTGISSTSTPYGIATDYTSSPAGTFPLTIEAGSSENSYSLKNGENYLSWSSGNSLTTSTTKNDASSWTIEFDASNNAIISNVATTARKLVYNASSPRFACYTSAQTAIQLFKQSASSVAAPSFTPAAGTYSEAQNVTISCSTSGALIYFTSDGSLPTNSSNQYTEPIMVNETTTIKAIAYVGTTASSVASATYTIQQPMTISEVRSQGTGSVFTQGTVTSCVGNTGYIQDATAAICVYGTSLTVGDNISVLGTLTTYNGLLEITNPQVTVISSGNNIEPETMTIAQVLASTNQGWYIRIENATVTEINDKNVTVAQGDDEVVVRFASADDINFDENDAISFDGNISAFNDLQIANPQNVTVQENTDPTISAENISIACSATNGSIAYTINNPVSNGVMDAAADSDWLTLGTSFDSPIAFTCTANTTTTARTATVVLTYTYNRATVSKEVTVTQAAYVAPTFAELPFSFNGGNAAIEETDGLSQEGLGTDYSSAPYLKFDGTGDWLLLQFNERPGTLTFDIKNNSFSGGTFKLQTSEDGVTYTDLKTYTEITGTQNEEFSDLGENVRYIKWIYTQKVSGNVGLGNIALAKYVEPVIEPSITIDPVTVEVDAEEHDGTLTVNYLNLGDEITAEVVLCDIEGSIATYDWFSAELNEDNNVYYIINANDGEARTAYFKVYALDSNSNDVYSNIVTVSQAAYVAPVEPGNWVLTDLADLTAGDVFVIVGTYNVDGSSYAMANDKGTSSAPTAVEVTIAENTLAGDINENIQWNISGDAEVGYTFYPAGSANTWLYCTNSNNGVRVGTNSNNIFVMEDGYLKNDATSRYVGIYNSQDWRCYTGTDGNIAGQSFAFYKKVSDDVTYTKSVAAYEGDGGYVLIASPVCSVAPSADNGFLTSEYDLYAFDQAQEQEWRNYEASSFNLVSGKGYMYASSSATTLTFTGQPYNGNGMIPLDYTEDVPFAGWNLVGNPYAVAATPNKPYYRLNDAGSEVSASTESSAVDAMEGVFVVATEAGQTVSFSTANSGSKGESIALNVMKNRGTAIDRAIVRFDEGGQLPKFQLFESSTKLYIPQGNSDYAIVRSAAEGEMPVNFKAKENGTYTISVNTENVEMDYLHLIDNMTGNDVDLLATPSYTFEATTRDYASRFRLVFSANEMDGPSTGSGSFAYFNGSEWQISNIGEATLQVVDVMGRIVKNVALEGNATVSINEMPGVYMMRLLNGNDVKVQKVVIR